MKRIMTWGLAIKCLNKFHRLVKMTELQLVDEKDLTPCCQVMSNNFFGWQNKFVWTVLEVWKFLESVLRPWAKWLQYKDNTNNRMPKTNFLTWAYIHKKYTVQRSIVLFKLNMIWKISPHFQVRAFIFKTVVLHYSSKLEFSSLKRKLHSEKLHPFTLLHSLSGRLKKTKNTPNKRV